MALLGRDTTVTGPFPAGAAVLLESLSGRERLGIPYNYELTLLCDDPELDPNSVLGKPMAVGIRLGNGTDRFFHGFITEFAKTGMTRLHTRYTAMVRPELSRFHYTRDCYVFNDPGQDVLSIVKDVLEFRNLTKLEMSSIDTNTLRAREYCVQYRESDLHFVQRLLEEEGIYYFFRHAEDGHTLVLANSIGAHKSVEDYESILYTPKERQAIGAEEHFWGMRVHKALHPGRHTVLSGYDHTDRRRKPPLYGEDSSREPEPGPKFEYYDNPGGLYDPSEAEQEAVLLTDLAHTNNTLVSVEGNTMGLGVGDLVALRPALDGGEIFPFWRPEDFGKDHLIVAADYRLVVNQYETGDVAGSDEPFHARYWLLDAQSQFRPSRTVQKPQGLGPQTALVVGPKNEEIWTDELGRVMIQFDWDRVGVYDENSTCWMRVSQTWAGAGWGSIHIPRIGQEVSVDFLEGDIDRPIINGRLYNADNMPPYDLPEHRTQSGIKSRSSKGGTASNFNEIRFEDKKGHEELHTQAEKDMSTLVKHCQTLNVGVDRDIVVGNDETTWVKANRTTTVGTEPDKNKDDVIINGTHQKWVAGRVTQIYMDDHMRKVDGEQEFHAEKNKIEHVKLTYTLNTDEKFQLNQSATNMTFEETNVTVNSAGMITMMAGRATALMQKDGMVKITSPKAINLVVGGSSGLAILPGAIAIFAGQITAMSGGGSKMDIGEKNMTMKSATISIEAENICSINGKKILKLNSP